MSDILAQVASNVDASRNAGNSVLYECVQVRCVRVHVFVGVLQISSTNLPLTLRHSECASCHLEIVSCPEGFL